MTHPLVTQLRFARSEFTRCLEGVSAEDAVRRIEPINAISWIVGHLANQEHFYWVRAAQEMDIAPELNDLVGYGKPASTPPYDEMMALWGKVTQQADVFLDMVDEAMLSQNLVFKGKPLREPVGKMLLRNIYHYWFHLGEVHAVRQSLGHPDLPDFVGDMSGVKFE